MQALHPVGLHLDHGLEGGGREPVGVAGHVVAGEGVVRAAGEFHLAVEFARAELWRPVEHHVLDEMGDAGDPGPLVAGADAEERVEGDVGDAVVLDEQNLEPVVELMDLDVLFAERGGNEGRANKDDRDEQEKLFSHTGPP